MMELIRFLEKSMMNDTGSKIKRYFNHVNSEVDECSTISLVGSITQITGLKIEATGICVPVGTLCEVLVTDTMKINAEVIGFSNNITYLMATEGIDGIKQGTRVMPLTYKRRTKVGMELLGRILDADGKPIDGRGPIEANEYYPLITEPINPLTRKKIAEPLDVGIKAINALLTVGKGQRIGIFAGSGVGKSVLLGMMTHFTKANIVVVGMVGERGREVKEFIEENLGATGLAKSVVVAAPADTSPLMRVNCAILATTIAEYYRDQGYDVLLIVDSLTRFAQAQREISLSIGELPATKGYTPSVFAKLSQLVERSGNSSEEKGSITAFYTVLVEGDQQTDPIADHTRSVLDGHIVLSRHLAETGHYPAIDIEQSISRVMTSIVDEKQILFANKFKQLYSAYAQNKDLVNIGMYQQGTDKTVDESIYYKDVMHRFLVQSIHEPSTMEDSLHQLYSLYTTDA